MTREEILAMEPGVELDFWIAEKVMGWTKGYEDDGTMYWATGYTAMPGNWAPSKNMAAAWEVVEEMVGQGFDVNLSSTILTSDFIDVSWGVSFWRYGAWPKATARNMPEAICKAALLTLTEDTPLG